MAKRIITALFIGFFLVLNAEATMVSFCVIETGLPQEGARNHHSTQWENAFFDVFFDAGYILSNAPKLRFESIPAGSMDYYLQDEIDEARMGGADYFIIAQLDFSPASQQVREISIFMYTITPSAKIHERKITGKTYRSESEEFNDIKTIIRGLVPHIRAR